MFKNISLKKSKRFVAYIYSDSHAGHLLGLLNPDTTFKEWDENGEQYESKPKLTKQQEYLWGLMMDNRERVIETARGDPIIVIHNGDLTIGLKYPNQMSFTAISNQLIAAKYNMYPWLDLKNLAAFRLTYGTQSHELYEGTAPRVVTTALEDKYPDKNIKLVKHGLLEINDVTIDYAHHGPFPGSRHWLKGNVARYYLRDLMDRKIKSHKVPPYIVLRAHYHEPIDERLSIFANGDKYVSWLFITASFQMLGDYAQQATSSTDTVTNGGLMLEFEGNQLCAEPKWLTESKDIRTKEKIEL